MIRIGDYPPTRLDTPVIRAEGICKEYRCGGSVTTVLRGVNLAVQRGECVFLVGPSGSGKTTLLSILGCILTPDQGRVRILDTDVTALAPRARSDLRRDRIGFVFQRFHLIRGLSAAANVGVPLTLQGAGPRKARRRALELLDMLGLADKVNSQPTRLSAGECQRVALARALAADPAVIFADEPTASLDAENGRLAIELLQKLSKEHGKTVVVVTHDSRVFPLADRIYSMENGQVVEGDKQP